MQAEAETHWAVTRRARRAPAAGCPEQTTGEFRLRSCLSCEMLVSVPVFRGVTLAYSQQPLS